MKVLVIGPSADKSKGGMSTVISEMRDDIKLCEQYNINFYESYIDGNKLKVLLFSIFSYLRFIFLGMNKEYDIYHIHVASYGSTFRKMLYVNSLLRKNKKIILHVHGAEYLKFYDSLTYSGKKKVCDMLEKSNVVIALSDDWKKKIDSYFSISNCIAIENGIDINKYNDAMTDITQHRYTMLALGRLGKRKGTYDLITAIESALTKVPKLKVFISGDGEVSEVKKIIKDRKLEEHIVVTGWININEKIELLSQSGVVLLPSYNEGLPMAILEGMAAGKGIISTKVGAIPEVIKQENGILITPGDIAGLADAIIKLCYDDTMLINMGKNNIDKIKKYYSMDTMHSKIGKVYNSLY